jgi:imidazolonepropionase-like amidohydrolase
MIAGLGVTELARADVTWLAPRTVSEPGREAHAMAARRDAAMLVSAPRVFDGTRLIKDGAVLIRGGHVVGVGPRTTLRVRDARRVSLKNATVLPGFIDLHVHADTPRSARDGVMTVRNLGQELNLLRPPRDRPGKQRSRSAGPIVSVPGGYPGRIWGLATQIEVRSQADAKRVVDTLVKRGASVIKVALEPGRQGDWPMLSREQLQAIVVAAHARKRDVTAHVERIDQMKQALASGVDELAHLPCDRADPQAMQDAARKRLRIVATLHVLDSCPAKLENARAFTAAGGRLLFGTDYPVRRSIPPGIDVDELRLLEAAGLTRLQTLAAATSQAGKALGEAPLGSLVRGAPADLFAVRGNPLNDLNALRRPLLAIAGGKRVR